MSPALELALQTTLLGLAIAIILALLAALIGPLLIDWSSYRSLFETQAGRLVGLEVRVTGEIDARLLPSPRLTMHGVEIGGEEKLRARSLGFELALGPLMRGEWRASELHLVGPQLELGLDDKGRVQAPNVAIQFSPDTLSIERLRIEDGKLTLADAANGAKVTLDRLRFSGEVRSLLGPVKGEGSVMIGGELYPFRIAAGRYGEEAGTRLHINVEPPNRALSVEADGTLTLGDRRPRFDGSLSLTRPVGIASRSDERLTQPWRLSGKIKASAASALMEQFEYQYGSDEQGIKLTGVADFKFGKQPRFDGVLSGRQLDLDRALDGGDGVRQPPSAVIRKLAEVAARAFQPAIPIQLGIGIDQITLGGNAVQNLRGDITTDGKGWNLDRFEFRAPGFTEVRLSGRLAVGSDSVDFRGPAEINASDPKLLAAWLRGEGDAAKGDRLRPLNLRGDVTLAKDRIAIERFNAEFDRKTIAGRLVYSFPDGSRATALDAELKAPELDIDTVLAFGKAVLDGSKLERPHDIAVAADIGRATVGGVEAREASVRAKINGEGLQIDRLSIADLGGSAISANGRIDTSERVPRGALTIEIESRQAAALAGLAARFAPREVGMVASLIERASQVKLRGTFNIAADNGDKSRTVALFAVAGDVDAMRLDARARMAGDWEKPSAADLTFDGTLDAADGAALIKTLGLDRVVVVGTGPGQLKLSVNGPADRDLKVDLRLRAGDLIAQSQGRGWVSLDKGVTLFSNLELTKADLRPLHATGNADESAPPRLDLNARVAIAGRSVRLDDIAAKFGGSSLRGFLALDGNISPRRIDGVLEADTFDVPSPLMRAVGLAPSAAREGIGWAWSSEPFGAGPFGDYTGAIALKARRVTLLPRLAGRDFRATLRFGKDEFSFDDVAASLPGGHVAGRLSFHSAEDGLSARAKIDVEGIDTAAMLSASERPSISGSLVLSAEVEGVGLSPVALIGSLQGAGKFTLADAQLAGLDARTFDVATRAVDQGLPVDSYRISDLVNKALDNGALPVKRAEGPLAISAGQVRLSNVSADSKDAKLSLAGTVDLTEGSIDARLLLSGPANGAAARPDIFITLKGPVAAPSRNVDVSALTAWLTLRAVDNQARQLRAIEGAPQPKPKPVTPKSERAPPLPPPLNIKPAPAPRRATLPEASAVGHQN